MSAVAHDTYTSVSNSVAVEILLEPPSSTRTTMGASIVESGVSTVDGYESLFTTFSGNLLDGSTRRL